MRPIGQHDSELKPRTRDAGGGLGPSAGVRLSGAIKPSSRPGAGTPAASGKSADASAKTQAARAPADAARPDAAKIGVSIRGAPLTPANSGDAVAKALGLPADRPALLAIAALVGERLGLAEARAVRKLVAARADDPAVARIAARAVAAGFDPGGPEAEAAIDAVVDGRKPSGNRDGDSSGGDKADEREAGPSGRESDSMGLIGSAALALKSALRRAVSDPLLSALARPGTRGGWTLFPFELSIAETSFAGVVRIWYDDPGAPARRVVIDARADGRRRILDIREGTDGPLVAYRSEDSRELEAFRKAFPDLARLQLGRLGDCDLEELSELAPVDGDA